MPFPYLFKNKVMRFMVLTFLNRNISIVLLVNAYDTETLCKVIKEGHYDSVINCIGILNQFAEQNKVLVSSLNSYFPHFFLLIL